MNTKKVSQAANLPLFITFGLLLLFLNHFPEIISSLNLIITNLINSFSDSEFSLSNEKYFSFIIFILMVISVWKILVVKNNY